MKTDEADRIIAIVFAEHEQPTKDVKLIWRQFLAKESFQMALEAAARLLKSKVYGKPRVSDFFGHLSEIRAELLPPSLKVTGREALHLYQTNKILFLDASSYADRAAPPVSEQFSSPEELDKAQRIRKAIWEREFIERYERQKEQALRLVVKGIEPKKAILEVVGRGGLVPIAVEICHRFLEGKEPQKGIEQ